MNILSLDTTAEICSVALQSAAGRLVFHERRPREHAKILLPEIERLLIQANLNVKDIDTIVFSRGPGSFTGVRIAAGVAQGLALSAQCSLVPISTLQSVAWQAMSQSKIDIWVALDARMSEVYFSRFRVSEDGLPIHTCDEQVIAPNKITEKPSGDSILVGNGWQAGYEIPVEFSEQVQQSNSLIELPHASDNIDLANKLLQMSLVSPVQPEEALPVYLRDNVTWNNKPKIGS